MDENEETEQEETSKEELIDVVKLELPNISGEEVEYIHIMTDEMHKEHINSMLEKAVDDGYMLQQQEFDMLHYEDPMVSQLKETDVSNML